MADPVPLSSLDHGDLRVTLGHGARFGDNVNQVLVLPTEFEEVQRDHPIILRRNDAGAYQAVALLGLERDENLFLADGERWDAGHVPLIRQRGPFRIGMPGGAGEAGGEPMLHVEPDHPRLNRSEGEPLFLPHGGHSPYLEHVVRIMRSIHEGLRTAPGLYAAWAEADLLEAMTLRLSLDDRTHFDVPDAFVIPPARLQALDGAVLERLNQAGQLRPAFLVSASMGTVSRLLERKARRRAAAASPASADA